MNELTVLKGQVLLKYFKQIDILNTKKRKFPRLLINLMNSKLSKIY